MKHAHVVHHGAELIEAARVALTAAGEQWTDMRSGVFEVLANAAGPVSAYDIAEVLSRREDRRVPANSIYRILDLFVARNLALRVESSNAYVANPHPGCVHDCIFLICDACNKTTHVDNDLASNSVRKSAAASSFTPVRTIIEVRGRCVQCA